jgi:hypothetical protein
MPESVDDPVFGRLEWDEKLDWWVGSIEFAPGHDVDVFVNPDLDGQPSTAITAARRVLARFREREPEYRRWSADQLHAERWNTDEPMTKDDIAKLLRVARLEFRSDGGLQIYWNDQDRLFWGHNVVTDVGPDGEMYGIRHGVRQRSNDGYPVPYLWPSERGHRRTMCLRL